MNARGIPTAAYQVLHLLPGVGYRPPPGRGTPSQVGQGGYMRWGTPWQGYPQPGLIGGYPRWITPPPQQGYPLPGPGQSTPHLDLAGVPLPRCGQTDGWMDRHVSKHNLPSYYVRGR